MNWGNFFEIGLKVVVAVGAGLAIFMGVSSATKKNETVVGGNNQDLDLSGSVNNNNTGDTVVAGLRAAQNTCGKLFNLAQGLVAVAEGVSAFRGNGNVNNYNFPGYGGYGYFQQPSCGSGWRRINPFIIESIPQGQPINYNTQYPF